MRRNLLSTFLLSIFMMLGVGSAWAQINELPYSADFESSIAPFDAGDIVDASGWGKALRVSNTTATATFGESVSALTENDEVTIQFNALHGWEGSKKTTKVALLNTDNEELISYTYNITDCKVIDVSIGGATVSGFASFMGQANFNNKKSANGFAHSQHYVTTEGYTPVVKFIVSGAGLATFSFVYTSANSTAINKEYSASLGNKKADLGKIVITDTQSNTDRCFGMDNLNITKETKVTYPYTVQFVDGDNQTIKTVEGRAEASAKITVDKESFWIDGKKYKYVSDDSETKLISAEGTNVITVNVSEADRYTYSVKDNIGNTLVEGEEYEGEDIIYYVPYFAFKEGKFYKTPSLSSGTLSYGQSTISALAANTEITVTYTEEENTNVVFYAEAENLQGITPVDDQYTKIRMSNGKTGYFANKTAFTTLPAGKYTVTSSTRSGATSFFAGENTVLDLSSTGAVTDKTSDEFALGKETEISASAGSASAYFDYVIIRKTGDVSEDEAAVILAKDSLQMDITAAKALDTTGKEGVDALNTAITTAEEALAAAAATVESLNAAKAALAEAVATFIKTTPILTLKATAGEEVTLTFGVWNSEDVFYVDFGNGELQSEKVGIDNKGPVKEDGTTGSATKFTGTVAGDGTIKVYGNNDIWYLITTNGAMPTTFDQPKLMNVVQMTITGADVESVALPAYPKMTQFNFNNSSVKSVDVTKVTTLTSLTINNTTASKYDPQLESIDLSKNTELDYLSLQGNQNNHGKLKTLDLSANTKLDKMYIQYNQLESVTLPAEASLSFINLQDNNLESLDLTGVTEFKDIYLSNNKLATIDLSKIKSGATINIDGNILTTLTIPVSIKTLNAKNNQLASVSLVNATTQCNLEGNKLTLATIPAQPAGLNTASKTKKFTYAPQAALQVAETVTTLDLSSQVTVANGELDPADYTKHLTANTTFSFVTAGGTALVKGTDYKVTAPGKFIFTKAQTEKVHGVMLNEALPKFTAAVPFTTTEFTIEAATGDTDVMTEAKALAADADAVAVGKLIDAIAAAEESGDEIELAAAVEQFKRDNAESGINMTAKVGTAKEKWVGAGGTAGSVKTIDGATTPLAELYSSASAGTKMSQTITGLENGLYRVKVFATSHNARGEDGAALNGTATDVAYVFATSGETTNKTWITASGVTPGFLDGEQTTPLTIEDIEVANGELTIGLTVDKEKQTGWHTIQIYSLERITTAKAAWAAAKADLQKSINAATDTLETGENGKDDLQAAIEVAKGAKDSNKLNVSEVVEANNVLNAAIHEFFESNLQFREDVVFYIQEKQTGKFLSRGAAWGTRAVVDDYGVPVQLTYVSDGKYTIKGIDNNSTYGDDGALYSDGNGDRMRSFIFTEAEGGYTITNSNNSKFVAVVTSGTDSLGVIANSETGSIFQVVSVAQRDEIVAANKKAAEEATIAAAGFKLTDPLMFTGKVDTLTFKTGSAWTFTAERDGSNAATNANGTEVFQGTGKFTQNIENVAAGLYKVTVQAMYRDGANGTVAALYDKGYNLSHAYLDANGSRVQVKSWGEDRLTDGNPNSMGEFASLAAEGKYISEGFAVVGEDGKLNLTVAVPSFIGAGWFIASQVTYQKVVVDSTALARTELEKAIAKAEATDTIQRTQETINTLKAAIETAKALVAKEDATAEELVAATTAIEDAIAGLKIEPIEGIDYSWESPKGNPIEWGGTIAYVNGDGNRLNYQNGGYYTICLNGKKANINEETPSANAGKMVITLDKALAAGDTIAYTAFINKDATGKKASPYIIFENGITAEGEVFSDEANIDAVCNGVPTLKYTIVPAEAAGSKTITLTRSQTGTNLFITKLQVIEKTELELALNVERYTGMGYGVTEATVDFTEAKAFLGVEAITEDMLSMLNPDGSEVAAKATDGWFNGEGVAETWGDNTKINVKFFEAIAGEGKYSICDMNGADEVGKTYSVKWQLKANGKKVIYTINVTFVTAPEFKPEIVKTIDVPVYMTAEAAYEGLTAQFDAAEVATALNIASIADAKAYIVNVTTGSFVENTTDGWRDANGDAAQWAAATNGVCAKIQNPASGTIDYLGTHDANFMENDTYTAKWGFVANEKAVVLNINITFKSAAFMTRINSLKSDSQQGVIYNMNGQKVNKAQKGLFIINGKKTVVK